MRYGVQISWWYEGEFKAAAAKTREAREDDGSLDSLRYMTQFRHDHDFLIEAESKEVAVAEGLSRVEIDRARVDEDLSSFRAIALPYVTIRELLDNAPVVNKTHDVYRVLEYFPEVDEYTLDSDRVEKTGMVRIDLYLDVCFDGRRGMELGCVYFEGEPVLVFQAAGRENRDQKDHWIISNERKRAMTHWLMEFVEEDQMEKETSLDEEILALSYFYGCSILDVAK